MVLGSNPIMVEVFFVFSLFTDRLRDYLKVKFRKALGTAAKAQISNWGQLKKTSSEPTYLYITLVAIALRLGAAGMRMVRVLSPGHLRSAITPPRH